MCEKGIVIELPELRTVIGHGVVLAWDVVISHGVAVVAAVHGLHA